MDREQIKKLRTICKNISVLYVEDDKDVSQHLEKLIRKIFVDVSIEKNGLLGLESFQKNRQDIVITDISMPIMDGIEMSKNIKLLNSDQNIIVTSAHNDTEYLVKLIEIGIDKFIIKPIDMNQFLSSISKIAIAIYREKRQSELENRLKHEKELQAQLLDKVLLPVAYFHGDAIVYANKSFKEQFFTKTDLDDSSCFHLGYIFKDSKYISMGNATLAHTLKDSKQKIFELMDANKKIFKKFNLNISIFKDETKYLVSIVNFDAIYAELNRFKNQIDYFPKRDSFIQSVSEYKNTQEDSFSIFCIGIKNIKKFIDRYGGVKMHAIYNNFAKSLKHEFSLDIENNELSIYLFETNRYILLVKKEFSDDIAARLHNFGKKYYYEYGSEIPFELDYIEEKIQKEESIDNILENTEGMLYTVENLKKPFSKAFV
ncbi:MAG: response regulator [Sulfurimonas sp.]|uniref:response regulator transcription factor n=1 Tax=Sulfurimonas sp. TaxID=2022749 RepID=UPI0026313328|nr:response regulator [Sulfurimonas sp.]MDD2652968.1 response regulator [Sulfurimonas sp.]MDD3452414.1 response regulator [Sulfurimonas sp.]